MKERMGQEKEVGKNQGETKLKKGSLNKIEAKKERIWIKESETKISDSK